MKKLHIERAKVRDLYQRLVYDSRSSPQMGSTKKYILDGKIGLWPFVTQTLAQRNSKNRTKGTLITKPIEPATGTEIGEIFFKDILPTIRKKWPRGSRRCPTFIQQETIRGGIL